MFALMLCLMLPPQAPIRPVFTPGPQTFKYKGRTFQFTATSAELADAVKTALRNEVDGTAPQSMQWCPSGKCPLQK